MGVKISKCCSSNSYNSFSTKRFFFYIFPVTQKLLIGILTFQFKKKKIEIFLHMGPYGRENFKTLLLLQF